MNSFDIPRVAIVQETSRGFATSPYNCLVKWPVTGDSFTNDVI